MDEQTGLFSGSNFRDLAKLDDGDLSTFIREAITKASTDEPPEPEPPTNQPSHIGLQADSLFDGFRPAPNSIIRSSAFGVVGRGKRDLVRGMEIETYGTNTEMTYSGERLAQIDFDVWMRLLEMQVLNRGEECLEFSGYSFLKSIGRGKSTRDYEALKESLTRLCEGIFRINSDVGRYIGTLLVEYDSGPTGYSVWPNPLMHGLLSSEGHITYIRSDIRAELRGGLSKWLHAFISSHRAAPLKSKVENVRKWCGSQTKQLYRFRQMLRRSCQELESLDFLSRWIIDDNDVLWVYAK